MVCSLGLLGLEVVEVLDVLRVVATVVDLTGGRVEGVVVVEVVVGGGTLTRGNFNFGLKAGLF